MSTFCAFIDFQKAFDFIDRDLLMYKLRKYYQVDGKFYNAIKAVNMESLSCVRLQDSYTDWFEVTSGVRQGDNLSPTLFCLYVNDLAKSLNELSLGVFLNDLHVTLLLYADDIVLFAPTEVALQEQLNFLDDWCQKWKLLVNESKTEIVHFRPKNVQKTDDNFVFRGCNLKVVNEYRYLGLVLTENLQFTS